MGLKLIPDDTQAILWIRNPSDPTVFDLWETDKEFWIEYPMESVLTTPEGLASAGQRPNPNQSPNPHRRSLLSIRMPLD